MKRIRARATSLSVRIEGARCIRWALTRHRIPDDGRTPREPHCADQDARVSQDVHGCGTLETSETRPRQRTPLGAVAKKPPKPRNASPTRSDESSVQSYAPSSAWSSSAGSQGIPHIIEVDHLGAAVYRGPITQAAADTSPPESVIKYELRSFLEDTRTISSDLLVDEGQVYVEIET